MKILFVGNSYTFYNDMPGMVEGMANSADYNLEVSQAVSGGKTLEWHGQNSTTLDALRDSKWDVVVLQEQSTRPVEEPDKMLTAAKLLKQHTGQAQVILYLTWARQHKPETQDALNNAYFNVARELGCGVAPVGLAWRKALRGSPGLVLHTDDRSHPNKLGSYLTACVFYGTLFRASPVGLPSPLEAGEGISLAIDPSLAKQIQMTAWDIVQHFRPAVTDDRLP